MILRYRLRWRLVWTWATQCAMWQWALQVQEDLDEQEYIDVHWKLMTIPILCVDPSNCTV